jgi:hypothetical protein
MGVVRVLHVPSLSQYVDIFTKGLPSTVFTEFRSSLNVCNAYALTVGWCQTDSRSSLIGRARP